METRSQQSLAVQPLLKRYTISDLLCNKKLQHSKHTYCLHFIDSNFNRDLKKKRACIQQPTLHAQDSHADQRYLLKINIVVNSLLLSDLMLYKGDKGTSLWRPKNMTNEL